MTGYEQSCGHHQMDCCISCDLFIMYAISVSFHKIKGPFESIQKTYKYIFQTDELFTSEPMNQYDLLVFYFLERIGVIAFEIQEADLFKTTKVGINCCRFYPLLIQTF